MMSNSAPSAPPERADWLQNSIVIEKSKEIMKQSFLTWIRREKQSVVPLMPVYFCLLLIPFARLGWTTGFSSPAVLMGFMGACFFPISRELRQTRREVCELRGRLADLEGKGAA
jgi:hypothetical protein